MTMYLQPLKPTGEPSLDEDGDTVTAFYGVDHALGIDKWDFLFNRLVEWEDEEGQLTKDFVEYTGKVDAITCAMIAQAIDLHLHMLPPEHQQWLQPRVAEWETCGGYSF